MRLKYTFDTMDLDNEIVAIPIGEGADQYHGVIKLNETAAHIFELLKNDVTEEEIVEALEKDYSVSREIIVADVRRYIDAFQAKGMLI